MSPVTPRYALVSDEGDERWAWCLDVEGLFTEAREPMEWRRISLLGCAIAGPLHTYCAEGRDTEVELGNLELIVLDHGGLPIGRYAASAAAATGCQPHAGDRELCDVAIVALLLAAPPAMAEAVWDRWRASAPDTTNVWAEYGADGRRAWLHVVRLNRAAQRLPGPDRPPGQTFELDGVHVNDETSFHCAIGEAINGPGGYFGADLDGLADCLRGGFGATPPFHLVWLHSEVASRHLVRLEDLCTTLARAGVTVELR
jgi:RNAse (barnase) inhibitor barstar